MLLVTIDEHEMHHLRTLLEDVFSDYYIQMTTDVINPKGVTQGRFSRVEEYNIFCFASNAFVAESNDNLLNLPNDKKYPRWKRLLRSGTDALRADREGITKFINDQGFLTYVVKTAKIHSYLKSLLDLAGLLTYNMIYQGAKDEVEEDILNMMREYVDKLHHSGEYVLSGSD